MIYFIFVIRDKLTGQITDPIIVPNKAVLARTLSNLSENSSYKTNTGDFEVIALGEYSYNDINRVKLYDTSSDEYNIFSLGEFIEVKENDV